MREKIELFFQRWGLFCALHPKSVLLGVIALSAFLASSLPPRFDTTIEGVLRKDSPAILTYDQLREQFGRDVYMIATITTDEIFTPAFIARLQQVETDAWKKVPWIDDLILLTNARAIYADGDDVRIEGLFENWPDTADMEDIIRRVQESQVYRNLVLSDDHRTTAILVRLQNFYPDEETGELLNLGEPQFVQSAEGMRDMLRPFAEAGDRVAVAGTPVVVTELQIAMQKDMGRFTLLTIVFVALMLWWLFRRFSAVSLPLLVVILAALGTMGLLAWTDTPLQMPLVILPSFLIAVGIGDSIHLISIFYQQLRRSTSVVEAIGHAMRHTGLAMFLTSITTAAGLLSFAGSDILPVSSLGWVAASGVMLAWFYSITLLPAGLALMQRFFVTGSNSPAPRAHQGMNRFTDTCIHLAIHYPRQIIVLSIFCAGVALWQASQLHFSHHPLKWLPEDWPIRQATAVIDGTLSGSMNVELLLDSGEQDGWRNSARMQQLAALTDSLGNAEFSVPVRKIQSVTDMLREMNQALHGGEPAYYVTPDNDPLLAQELFLLEMSAANDLYRRVDRDYRTTRITLSVPWVDTLYYATLVQELETLARSQISADIKVTATGMVPVLGRTLAAVIIDTARSYGIAFVVIGIMMMLLLGRIKAGVIAMIPNLLPILMALGFMHAAGIPLDMFSMLVGAIAMGLAVDDTIHFMHHYEQNRSRGASPQKAIELTLHESGRAMLTTSIILAGGFMVFIFSQMNNLTGFGLVTAFTIAVALLADFLLAPALMYLTDQGADKDGNR